MSEHDEPVAWMDRDGCLWNTTTHPDSYTPLYTRPAQWQGLTDGEIEKISDEIERSDFFDVVAPFARAIESALKEKNGGV